MVVVRHALPLGAFGGPPSGDVLPAQAPPLALVSARPVFDPWLSKTGLASNAPTGGPPKSPNEYRLEIFAPNPPSIFWRN